MSAKPKNHWLSFDIQTLLIVMATIAIVAAYIGIWTNRPRDEELARRFHELDYLIRHYRVSPSQVRQILGRQPAAITSSTDIFRWRCWTGTKKLTD